MQKKVYLKDLSFSEIYERLSKGEKIYDESESNCYYKLSNNVLVQYEDNILVALSPLICTKTNCHFFLDDVEEPEADESCIGKLCWVWCDNKYAKCVDILIEIDTEETYKYRTKSNVWTHCQALTKEEASDFIKE